MSAAMDATSPVTNVPGDAHKQGNRYVPEAVDNNDEQGNRDVPEAVDNVVAENTKEPTTVHIWGHVHWKWLRTALQYSKDRPMTFHLHADKSPWEGAVLGFGFWVNPEYQNQASAPNEATANPASSSDQATQNHAS